MEGHRIIQRKRQQNDSSGEHLEGVNRSERPRIYQGQGRDVMSYTKGRRKQGNSYRNERNRALDTKKRLPHSPYDKSYTSKVIPISEHEITEISQLEENEVVNSVSLKIKGFQKLLDTENLIKKRSIMNAVLTILTKTMQVIEKTKHVKANGVCQKANLIIGEALSNRRARFCLKLKIYLQNYWHHIPLEQKFQICCLFCKMLQIFPATSWSVLPVKELQSVVQSAPILTETSELNSKKESLQDMVDTMISLYDNAKESPVLTGRSSEQEWDNSEYKNIPIMPTWNEIIQIQSTSKKRLRENISKGRFDDWLHYYDIHFRLLREDFVAPLRKGVHDYLRGIRGRELNNIKVYTKVRLLSVKCSMSGICFKISIGTIPTSSERLIHGSLICLSYDDFKEHIFFATVDNRVIARGELDIIFHDVSSAQIIEHMTKVFVMVESYAYFEAYRHILHSLQRAEVINMPFSKYLIDVDCHTVGEPRYLTDNPEASYNLCHLLKSTDDDDTNAKNKELFSEVKNICDISSWPSLDLVDLDKSQLDALQNGLTQEICVIQGPPGTGKTYIGLKIVETLLKNENNWNSSNLFGCKSPILVMCYSNHALDQFLEGILDCPVYRDKKTNIPLLRIGSRTKSERLEKLSIQNKRKNIWLSFDIRRERELAYEILHQCEEATEMLWDIFKLSLDTIVPLQYLKEFLDANHDYFFYYGEKNPERKFRLWLIPENVTLPSTLAPVTSFREHRYTFHEGVQKQDLRSPTCMEGQKELLGEEHAYHDADIREDGPIEDVDDGDDYYISRNKQKNSQRKKIESIIPRILESQEKWVPRRKMTQVIHYLSTLSPMTEQEAKELQELDKLSWIKRLELYKYWVMKYQNHVADKCTSKFQEYNESCKKIADLRNTIDQYTLETASIIGMTTTGAAKYQHILQLVKPRIVIVEEAAEVLESHIVSALNAGTQQLILIGDHKQLRPKPNEYEVAKRYKLDVSLFERLILNGHPHVTLNIQHRMRPEIAQLVHPHIYDTLYNHTSVEQYPDVRGVSSNIFLITHKHLESEDAHDCSHSNDHEVDFLVALCKYLLQQNYSPSQITILVTYSGQLYKMKQKMSKEKILEGVRTSTVDNFQGEENDIILLSLVRSNENDNIGFLKQENRVCVSLSRARQGFYCIGNFQLLRTQSLTWEHIISDMESKRKIGDRLTLQCHIHPEETFTASNSDEFEKNSRHGGCHKRCCYRLPSCGHVCSQNCHTSDPDHKSYVCMKKCDQKCPKGHPCPLKCHQGCKPCKRNITLTLPCQHEKIIQCFFDPDTVICEEQCSKKCPTMNHPCKKLCYEHCGNCKVKVPKVMAGCNHKVYLPCHIPPLHENCPKKCAKLLACSHKCALKCGKVCSNGNCLESVEVKLECQHEAKIPCWRYEIGDYNNVECTQPCGKTLPCTHPCPKLCHEPCAEKCTVMVNKNYPCHHVKKDFCHKSTCARRCAKNLECGHPCPNPCGNPCAEKCLEKVRRKYPCGHQMEVSCSSTYTDTPCTKLCEQMLICGHKCEGQCHISTSLNVHKICKFRVELNRFCGHHQTVTCAGLGDVACSEVLELLCAHGRQHIPCHSRSSLLCQEPCKWRCDHYRCSKKCSEKCDRLPCDKPCRRKLYCGHMCYGLCGEPCLKYCPTCDTKKFNQHLRGSFKRSTKYYQLTCGHIFAVQDLDDYAQHIFKSLPCMVCPLFCPVKSCHTPMSISFRYSDAVKCCLERMQDVREEIYSNVTLFTAKYKSILDPLLKLKYFSFLKDFIRNKSNKRSTELLYLASLLSRSVMIAKSLSDSTCSIGNELVEQVKLACSLLKSNLTYSVMHDMERNYLRQCLETQNFLAKKSFTSSTNSIRMAESFLKALSTQRGKMDMVKEICFHLKLLADDFPQAVAFSYENILSDIKLRHPILQKGVWWYCSKGHYYCTPASRNKTVSRHCPECAGSFFDYAQISNSTVNSADEPKSRKRPLPQDATPDRSGGTRKRRRLENSKIHDNSLDQRYRRPVSIKESITPERRHHHWSPRHGHHHWSPRHGHHHWSPRHGHHHWSPRHGHHHWSPRHVHHQTSPTLQTNLSSAKRVVIRRESSSSEAKRSRTANSSAIRKSVLNHTSHSVFDRLGGRESDNNKKPDNNTSPRRLGHRRPKVMDRLGPSPHHIVVGNT